MSGITDRAALGCKIEAELWRNGKLVPDDKPKPKNKLLVIRRPNGISFIELSPREKTNDN